MFKYLNYIKSINDLLLIVFHVIVVEKILLNSRQKKYLFNGTVISISSHDINNNNDGSSDYIDEAAIQVKKQFTTTKYDHCSYCEILNNDSNNCNNKSIIFIYILLSFQLFTIQKCQCFHRKEIRRKKSNLLTMFYL